MGIHADQGVTIPVLESALDELEMEHLKGFIDPVAPSACHGHLYS